MPAREKTLRGVCELLATQARRPLVPPANMLGRECASAGVFLAMRALLVQVGAPPDLRPSAVNNLRSLTEAIVEQLRRSGFGPEKS
jgi:hypothetical protein